MRTLPILSIILVSAPILHAAEFQGADAILKRLAEERAKPAAGADHGPGAALAELREKLAAFRAGAADLAPEEAARQWLALFDAFSALPAQLRVEPGRRDPLDAGKFFQALPPPSAWDALAAALDRRANDGRDLSAASLGMFAALLRGDDKARRASLAALRQSITGAKLEPWEKQHTEQQLDALAAAIGAGADRIAQFEKQLEARESKDEGRGYFGGKIEALALVDIAGKEKAGVLLRRAFALGEDLSIEDKATRRLAVALALEDIATLKKPLWSLVQSVEDAPLYEALAKRFPDADANESHVRQRADTVYLASLIVGRRVQDAARFISERRAQVIGGGSLLNHELTAELVRQGQIEPVHGVLRELLGADPALPFWGDFIELSARLGQADRALAFLREIDARDDLSPEARANIRQHLAGALLAADEVDEGLELLRTIVKQEAKAAAPDANAAAEKFAKQFEAAGAQLSPEMLAQFAQQAGGAAGSGAAEHALQLARLGRLLERPEPLGEGIAAARGALAKSGDEGYRSHYAAESLAKFLVEIDRGADAEGLAADELIRAAKPNPARPSYGDGGQGAEFLAMLAAIYHRAGRHADVLRLLDEAVLWNAGDLAQLAGRGSLGVPLLFAGAQALAEAGKAGTALQVLNRLLEHQPGYDPAYRLLLELGGDGLEARLDELARRDRFEERPLIWKARLQLDGGRPDDAEKTVRAAIAIDPSDGEQGKGDRMRAYAVLADVLEKKGDAAQAKIMRGAVEAIRLSEQADDWWEAGLLTRAVRMYEDALGHFADAYCIQSRLALRYSELGKFAEAEQHYLRAFELMPESFGRIESHCFGCEGAFEGKRAQGVAERVFTRLATEMPGKAQVFYLLGYLRQEQGRHAEASVQFRRAVEIDPDYFNAWKKLSELSEETALPQAEIEAAVFAMLRLDPNLRRHSGGFEKVQNLRALWDAVLAGEKARPPAADTPIYPLAAAAAELQRRIDGVKQARGGMDGMEMDFEEMTRLQMPGRSNDLREEFAGHPVFQALAWVLADLPARDE